MIAVVSFLCMFFVFLFFNIELLTKNNWRILYCIFLLMIAVLLFALITSIYIHYQLVKLHQYTFLRGMVLGTVLLFMSLLTGRMAVLTVLDLFASTRIISGGCVIERKHYRRGPDFYKVNFSADEYVYVGQDDYELVSSNPKATYSSCKEEIEVEYTPYLKVSINVGIID